MGWTQTLTITAVLAVGVVYGTDMFFAVVARAALRHVSEVSLTEVMGRLHEYADRRMPLFGVVGMVSALALVFVTHLGTSGSDLALTAFVAQAIHLSLYTIVAKPVNERLTEAARRIADGEAAPGDARRLQQRWDSVITARALLLALSVVCLLCAGLTK